MGIDRIMTFVNAKTNDDARRAGIATLGSLRDALAEMPPALAVVIDNGWEPGGLTSYRGYYERLAITPADGRQGSETVLIDGGPTYDDYQAGVQGVTIATPCTVADLLHALNLADGEEFEGYKGGQFPMGRYTFMHVAEYGDCGRAVSGVRMDADRAVIETFEEA